MEDLPQSSTRVTPPSSSTTMETSSLLKELSLANILENHSSSGENLASSLVILRILLLRHPERRSVIEAKKVRTIMSWYNSYVKARSSENNIVCMIFHDWESIPNIGDIPD
eukprot:scaffold5341_cov72-Cyclotella_meneghiniana.AAC.2